MKIWIVLDTENEVGACAIKGIFANERMAKMFIADYVLENSINTDYLELAECEVTLNDTQTS